MKVLMIANEYPWPPDHGGRKRMARIAEALSEHVELTVMSRPPSSTSADTRPGRVHWRAVRNDRVGRAQQFTRPTEPFIGRRLIGGAAAEISALVQVNAPDLIYWTHSYLPAVRPNLAKQFDVPSVVEFANVEQQRFSSLSQGGSAWQRRSARLETFKARVWEPRVAREAAGVVALSPDEEMYLRGLNQNVCLAPNGFDAVSYTPSPSGLVVLTVGTWDYLPNRDSLRRFLRTEWPGVVAALPESTLRVVGRGGEAFAATAQNVEAAGRVEDLSAEYARCRLVLAPADTGGGSQLKVAEALSHGRVVVGPMYLNREVTPRLPRGALRPSSSVVDTIVAALREDDGRHELEREICDFASSSSWSAVGSHLSAFLDSVHSASKRI